MVTHCHSSALRSAAAHLRYRNACTVYGLPIPADKDAEDVPLVLSRQVLQELAVVLPSPRFPCAGILLDMLRVRVSAVLTSEETGVTENRPSTDPQSQLLVFYMEVLSRMTTMQLCVQKVHMDQELLACRYGLHLGSGDGAGAGARAATAQPRAARARGARAHGLARGRRLRVLLLEQPGRAVRARRSRRHEGHAGRAVTAVFLEGVVLRGRSARVREEAEVAVPPREVLDAAEVRRLADGLLLLGHLLLALLKPELGRGTTSSGHEDGRVRVAIGSIELAEERPHNSRDRE